MAYGSTVSARIMRMNLSFHTLPLFAQHLPRVLSYVTMKTLHAQVQTQHGEEVADKQETLY